MSKNDAVVKELLVKVEEQKKGLGTRPRGTWITNGLFKNSQITFNINTISDFSVLAQALGFLMAQADYYEKACHELGIKTTSFKWDGYSLRDWQEDFAMRVSVVEWNERKRKLDETTAKLKGLMSEDARTEEELEAIKASLN